MRLVAPGAALAPAEVTLPPPRGQELRLTVQACGVCRTDLHLLDNELPDIRFPVTPGHEIVGIVAALGPEVTQFHIGDRVGVPWLGYTCGACEYCRAGSENLCERARFTGYSCDGGYAQEVLADARYCLALPGQGAAAELAPLLCAGLIGYRAYRVAGEPRNLGLYGFGAAAHLLAQVVRGQGRRVFAFTRPGDAAGQRFARELGAVWAGGSDERPGERLDAAIVFAPVGALIPAALACVRPGGGGGCGGISVPAAVGRPFGVLGRESHPRRRAGIPRSRHAHGPGGHGAALCAQRRESRPAAAA